MEILSARDSFIFDYLVVVENDYVGWHEHLNLATKCNNNMTQLSDTLSENWDTSVNNMLDKIDPTRYDWRVNVMRQMLLNMGTSTFDKIAKHIIQSKTEG